MSIRKIARDDELLDDTAPEQAAELILLPFQRFARWQVSGGFMLLAFAVVALAWANSPFAGTYEQMLHLQLGLSLGEHTLRWNLLHAINDGLMAVFFFSVGLEIKREFLIGELAERRKAMLPIAAAAGGMIVPALIFVAFNYGGEGARGWGVPMATDIAFALAALAVLGSRIPTTLKVFLVALAIVDDLGALLVIAMFYTATIDWNGLALAALFLIGLFAANRAGVRSGLIYLVFALGVWAGLFISGVHATLAGVLTAIFVPARVKIVPEALTQVIRRGADDIDAQDRDDEPDAMDPERIRAISVLTDTLEAATSPLQRFENAMHPWVAYAILPVFALFNAGVVIDTMALRSLSDVVPLGIIAGLVLGKPIGICGASWLALKTGLATLPDAVSWRQLIGSGFLAGIGFTMALFISGLAFQGTGLESEAKLAVLVASLLAAAAGVAILLTTTGPAARD